MQRALALPRLGRTRLPEAPIYLGAAFAFLIIIVISSMTLLEHTQRLREEIDTSLRTQVSADRIMVLLRRMESGQRGYLLSGNEDFLSVYQESVPLLPQAMAGLARDIVQDEEEQRIWREAEPFVQKKMEEMSESIRLYNAGAREQALNLIRGESGLRFMDEVRRRMEAIRDIETAKLSRHYENARRQEWVLIGINLVAVSLIIGVGLFSLMTVRRANSAMAAAQAILRDANTELEANVAARTADLRAANEEIQKFAYIVSHDLRSPLVNIMGFTSELEMLKGQLLGRLKALQSGQANGKTAALEDGLSKEDKLIAEDFEEALSFIKASITKMDRLINAVLTISREGNRSLRPEEIDMTALLDNMSKALAHQAQEADAQIQIAPLPSIVSDRLALEQIFSNLLDNALKYLRRDTIGEIRVSGRAEGNRVIIEVQDNGRGIEAKDQERVFELFRRAGPQDRPGEGMGLAHVRALVRRLGGVIALKSTPGEGSTFIVTLPRSLPQPSKRMSA